MRCLVRKNHAKNCFVSWTFTPGRLGETGRGTAHPAAGTSTSSSTHNRRFISWLQEVNGGSAVLLHSTQALPACQATCCHLLTLRPRRHDTTPAKVSSSLSGG